MLFSGDLTPGPGGAPKLTHGFALLHLKGEGEGQKYCWSWGKRVRSISLPLAIWQEINFSPFWHLEVFDVVKNLRFWSITRAPNPCPGKWDTVPLLRPLMKSRPLDSKPLSWSQKESALGKTILKDISALYPFISSHRCIETILLVQWNRKWFINDRKIFTFEYIPKQVWSYWGRVITIRSISKTWKIDILTLIEFHISCNLAFNREASF